MRNEISIREWVERFNDDKYTSGDIQTQIEAGWYDWFCRDNSLANKTKRMGNIINRSNQVAKLILRRVIYGLRTTVLLMVRSMMILELLISKQMQHCSLFI